MSATINYVLCNQNTEDEHSVDGVFNTYDDAKTFLCNIIIENYLSKHPDGHKKNKMNIN